MNVLAPSDCGLVTLSAPNLDALMPMHMCVDAAGKVSHVGPTLQKMLSCDPIGLPLFELIEVRRPMRADSVSALLALEGRRLSLVLCDAPDLPLRGIVTGLSASGGLIFDVSLGLSFVRAVTDFDFTLNDFSPCDQTVELMYLYEANTSTRHLSKRLSERLEAARAAAEAQALSDALTGLANRRGADLALQRALLDTSDEFALLHIDLDHFKYVNDTFGHAAGDAVLERVGQIFRTDLRLTDFAGRVGGDEFLVILSDVTKETDLGAVAERLITSLERPIHFEDHLCRISASIGIACTLDYDGRPTADDMLADTDAALYRAKRGGRGRFARFGEDDDQVPKGRRAGDPQA